MCLPALSLFLPKASDAAVELLAGAVEVVDVPGTAGVDGVAGALADAGALALALAGGALTEAEGAADGATEGATEGAADTGVVDGTGAEATGVDCRRCNSTSKIGKSGAAVAMEKIGEVAWLSSSIRSMPFAGGSC